MRYIFLLLLIGSLTISCSNNRTELVLLGTVHQPVENFNPDSLYNILVKIDPDLILFEVDSSFFTKDFEFTKTWGSNENMATIKYMENFEVDVRPYEFTGRNEYRINIGSRPTDHKAMNLLDSLYTNNLLDSLHQITYEEFKTISDSLNSFAILGAKAFNNASTDDLAKIRQDYHYDKLLKIIQEYSIFADTFHIKADNDSISFAEGYKRASKFWQLRNQTMAKHILHFTQLYRGKKIVVLNGYFHRYYLNSLLRPKQEELGFIVREFYEYK